MFRGCLDNHLLRFPMISSFAVVSPVQHSVAVISSRFGSHKLNHMSPISSWKYMLGLKLSKSRCMLVGMEERSSSMVSHDLLEDGESVDDISPEEMLAKPLSSSQVS